MADNGTLLPPPRRGFPFGVIIAIIVVLAIAAGPLVLHFGQKRHNQLPFDLAARFPDSEPLVGGEAFATTVAEIMDHELHGVTGWRPNDFILWGPSLWADNNANRQLGILQALRESVRVLKDHLTKVSSDPYDDNLVAADTALRNDAFKLWLPSAESKYAEAVQRLRAYVDGLRAKPPRSKPINQRNMELIRLIQAWTDLLGDAHAALYRSPESVWRTDDDFYHAQGVAHVIFHLVRAIEREYRHGEETKPIIRTLFDEVATALGQAAAFKPFIVFDGSPSGLFANHRRNLDAYISEARQKLYSVREELEK
ncbi:MAG: DUF2333 family protein [Deltaproteobacteria bacterium]|nr:DUF2333 family protein [Deltaproteobacteria bacterium]MBI3387426.1 DUF2333 family protein [Deltaproteobacteria bacterium]